jgi:predicted hotdog family 3-hydroxylacyl-ACP dehydratase
VTPTARTPAELLRHRGPALLVGTIEAFDGDTIACASSGDGPWRWPLVLEGAAQAAGLLAGLHGGLSNRAVIAEYRGVVVHAERHDGPISFRARIERRLLHFWRCRIEARAAGGALLLEGRVSLAPQP